MWLFSIIIAPVLASSGTFEPLFAMSHLDRFSQSLHGFHGEGFVMEKCNLYGTDIAVSLVRQTHYANGHDALQAGLTRYHPLFPSTPSAWSLLSITCGTHTYFPTPLEITDLRPSLSCTQLVSQATTSSVLNSFPLVFCAGAPAVSDVFARHGLHHGSLRHTASSFLAAKRRRTPPSLPSTWRPGQGNRCEFFTPDGRKFEVFNLSSIAGMNAFLILPKSVSGFNQQRICTYIAQHVNWDLILATIQDLQQTASLVVLDAQHQDQVQDQTDEEFWMDLDEFFYDALQEEMANGPRQRYCEVGDGASGSSLMVKEVLDDAGGFVRWDFASLTCRDFKLDSMDQPYLEVDVAADPELQMQVEEIAREFTEAYKSYDGEFDGLSRDAPLRSKMEGCALLAAPYGKTKVSFNRLCQRI